MANCPSRWVGASSPGECQPTILPLAPDHPMRLKKNLISIIARSVMAANALPRDLRAPFLVFGLIAEGRTMLSPRRLNSLYFHCTDQLLPSGSFVECGVARGGALAIMSFASGGTRSVWGFDSFEGMPDLTQEDRNDGKEWVGYQCSGAEGVKEAKRTLRRFHVGGDRVKLVIGWFEDTLPRTVLELAPIAVLRLDNDWYKSTRFCLETLYSSVTPGGLVIIDDYHTFIVCRNTVDEFRDKLRIKDPMITTEAFSEAYWRKTE